MIATLRGDVADAGNNVGIGDAVMHYEKQLRAQYKAVLAKEQAFKFWEAPHLHKRDGSYTNW